MVEFNKEERAKARSEILLSKMKAEVDIVKDYVKNDVTGPVVASFGFIIALIWRDAIQAAINEFLKRAGLTQQAYIYQFISAVIVTIIVIVIMVVIIKISKKRKEQRIEEVEKKLEG